VATADKAQEFYKTFPNDTNAPAAKAKELEMLTRAFSETYATNQFPRLFRRATALAKDVSIDKTNRFNVCRFVFMTTLAKRNLLPANIDVAAELAEVAHIAARDLGDVWEVHIWAWLAEDLKSEKTRPMFRQIAAGLQKMADDPVMSGFYYRSLVEIASLQRKMIGKPIGLQFTTLDGRDVNTTEMRGRVVVIDFWGTSYPECIKNVLRLEKLYHKSHTRDLEITGVNVDQDSETLKMFVSDNKISWPQYWDGKELDNRIIQTNHVIRVGTILLIDKKGILRDMNGDGDMDKKIEALLKE